MSADQEIIEIALKLLSKSLDELVSACMDESGSPKAPTKQELMRARGMLPLYCKNTLNKPR